MATPNVADLFSKALNDGSVSELREILKNFGRKAFLAILIASSCNEQDDTWFKIAFEGEYYDVIEFLVHQIKTHVMCGLYKKWKISTENVSPFSWGKYHFKDVSQPFVLSPDIAIIRDICHQIPMTKFIEYLIDVKDDDPLWLEFVLNSIMASNLVPRPDKIVALECMGIAFIFKQVNYVFHRRYPLNEVKLWRGLRCWKDALILRRSTDPAIAKIPCELSEMARQAFGDVVEITTLKEIDELEQQWALIKEVLDWTPLRRSLEAQAVLVGHRIFNQTASSFHLANLLLFSNNYRKQYSRAFNICLVILDQSSGFDSTSSHKCVQHFIREIDRLLIYFDTLWPDPTSPETGKSSHFLSTVQSVIGTLTKVSSVSPKFDLVDKSWQVEILRKIYILIKKWISVLTQEEIENLKEYLYPFFRVYNSNNGATGLLHLAVDGCLDGPSPHMTTYSTTVQIILLFLEAGADPQTTDANGQSPFHLLFEGLVWTFARSNLKVVFKAMMDAGGHLDQATPSGKTVISLIKEWRASMHPFSHIVRDPYFDTFIYSVLPLSCNCAQVVRRNGISFENKLPPSLHLFVLRHSPYTQ